MARYRGQASNSSLRWWVWWRLRRWFTPLGVGLYWRARLVCYIRYRSNGYVPKKRHFPQIDGRQKTPPLARKAAFSVGRFKLGLNDRDVGVCSRFRNSRRSGEAQVAMHVRCHAVDLPGVFHVLLDGRQATPGSSSGRQFGEADDVRRVTQTVQEVQVEVDTTGGVQLDACLVTHARRAAGCSIRAPALP